MARDRREREKNSFIQVLAVDNAEHGAGKNVVAGYDGRYDEKDKRPRLRYALDKQRHCKCGTGDDEPYDEQDVEFKLLRAAMRFGVCRAAAAAGAAETPADDSLSSNSLKVIEPPP